MSRFAAISCESLGRTTVSKDQDSSFIGADFGSPEALPPVPFNQRRPNGVHSTSTRGLSMWTERPRLRQNLAICTRTWPVMAQMINAPLSVLSALADAMCEFPAATSSDTDEEEFHRILFLTFSWTMSRTLQLGDRLEACLTEEEMGRAALCCHFGHLTACAITGTCSELSDHLIFSDHLISQIISSLRS